MLCKNFTSSPRTPRFQPSSCVRSLSEFRARLSSSVLPSSIRQSWNPVKRRRKASNVFFKIHFNILCISLLCALPFPSRENICLECYVSESLVSYRSSLFFVGRSRSRSGSHSALSSPSAPPLVAACSTCITSRCFASSKENGKHPLKNIKNVSIFGYVMRRYVMSRYVMSRCIMGGVIAVVRVVVGVGVVVVVVFAIIDAVAVVVLVVLGS